LLLGITLAAGIAIGVSYERRRASVHETGGGHSEHMIEHLVRQLDLDSRQRDTVMKIFARRQHAIDSTWNAVQPRVHATIDSTLREIAGVLRPDQLARYRRMIDERHPQTVH
jgi:hypothetical protein